MPVKFLIFAFIFLVLSPCLSEAKITLIPEIEVVGEQVQKEKSEISIKSETLPSTVHVITGEDLEKTNVRHYTDFYRKVPAMKVIYMGQGEVGDRLGTRGFWNGYAVFVDGVPLNMPHHMHLHGLADAAWLLPEMIERVEVIKGPFSALYGNFALGGVINIITKKVDKSPSVGAEVGSFGVFQGVATVSNAQWSPTPFLVYEAYTKDGYRDNSNLTRYNLFNKITFPFWDGKLSIRANYVKRDWGAPGYLVIDDVKKGLVNKKSAVNQTDDGSSEYYNLVINYSPKTEEGLHGTLYLASEDFNRVATFQPSPQRWEHNKRVFYGWNILYNYLPYKNLSLIFGTDGRFDDGSVRRYNTQNRTTILANTHNWDVEELSIGLFTQIQWKPIEYVKLTGGLRYDRFDFDIENKIRPNNSGSGDTYIISPKIGFVITPVKNITIFANKGLGFRSPYVAEMSPHDRDYKNMNLKPAKVDTWDVGFNTLVFDRLSFAFNYYQTEMEREIRVVGGETLNIGRSKRDGYEGELRFFATNELTLFVSYAWVKARIKNPAVAGQDRVTNVPEDYITAGVEWVKNLDNKKSISLDLYTQVYGKTPLDAAGTTFRDTFGKYYAKVQYKMSNITLYAGAIYHPKEYISEGQFIVNNLVVYDPRPKWDINAGIKYHF
ncbi:MAG: TonB-dependent receptor [Thermodesulfovibrionales bacterium]|nr:TonB-dependent receptor [Thermodesulfovibrionales bacterium]